MTEFDILKKDRNGTFSWLEAVQDLETAQDRLLQLSQDSGEEFLAFRQQDLRVVATARSATVVSLAA
jgi:hypothetical protein